MLSEMPSSTILVITSINMLYNTNDILHSKTNKWERSKEDYEDPLIFVAFLNQSDDPNIQVKTIR